MTLSILIVAALIASAAIQIQTKSHDGSHEDQPQFDEQNVSNFHTNISTDVDIPPSINWTSHDLFDIWKIKFDKRYATPEENDRRRVIFYENVQIVNSNNLDFDAGRVSFKMAKTKFCDLTAEEFIKYHTGYKPQKSRSNSSYFEPSMNQTIPDEFDWRQRGAVTPAKSQRNCSSSWVFAAGTALASHTFLKTGDGPISLSAQQLFDCVDENLSSYNCSSGYDARQALDYIAKNGINTESLYPYVSGRGIDKQKCKYDSTKIVARCQGYKEIRPGDEEALKQAIATVGPVVGSFHVDDRMKLFHMGKNNEGEIFDVPDCSKEANYQALIVGYGKRESDGKEYWFIKNYWGANWNRDGYFKLARNKNLCGIADNAFYPIV